ncbi:thermonuclease family protein [Variibacter gotjawalensis]|uniref:thermonuclease family protein n=1 Tax=Variibacter gotjawalensis TaxID=1333996 RepID=UPI001D37FFCD|nr:thermonuclease family protein [Variibacter gotjawalensis]NIK47014.1 endonuclease YncB(thermonuclease family) [Variibacter gotjawalensis]
MIWLLVVGAIAAVGWWREQSTPALSGQARVIDGDSLWVGSTEIRIYGIDAVELHQSCTRAGQPWSCGSEAAQALRRAINGRAVSCRSKDRDRYGRTVATCSVGGLDLGAAMIKGGYAVAYGAYEADEREARDAGRGIWSSQFEPPGVWRSRNPRRPSP